MLTAFLFTFAVSAALTPAAGAALKKIGFWNVKDTEHKNRIVRGGGIAIAVACIFCFFVLSFFCSGVSASVIPDIAPSVLFLLGTGLIDDKTGLRARQKLLLQTMSVCFLWICGYQVESMFGYRLPWALSLAATLLWGVAILNAFNLIDGLDGLCTGNAMICAAMFMIMASMTGNATVSLMAAVLAGACAGFLIFNFHPAKLFLGDTGSLFLGLSCAALSLKITDGNFNIHNTAALLLVFWIPFCDLGLAVWRRKVKSLLKSSGCKIMGRDLLHLHYRLLNVTHRHSLTVMIMWLGMIGFDMVSFVIFRSRSLPVTIVLYAASCAFSLALFAQYEIRYSECLLRYRARRFWERHLRRPMEWKWADEDGQADFLRKLIEYKNKTTTKSEEVK